MAVNAFLPAGTAAIAAAAPSAGASGAGTGWWGPILTIGANVLGTMANAAIANKGADDQRDALNAASNAQLGLSRDIFNTNLKLNHPFYQGAGNAFNLLSNLYGLPAQTFTLPSQISGGYGSNGASAANNWGAGQPVVGHSGGGGPNAFTGAAGAAIGNAFGGPVGGLVGGALGGLFRNGGDNWTTIATGAPEGLDYDAYWAANPDLAADPNGWSKPDVQSLFGGNRNAYINWFANRSPDRAPLQKIAAPAASGDSGSGTAPSATSPTMGDPLQMFWDSPDGKLATNQFLTIDNPAIKGAFATAGKSLSGAQQIALADRGAAQAGNAFGNYRSGLERLASGGSSAVSSAQSAGNNYQTTAGNAFQNIGNANAGASKALNDNWGNALKNGVTDVYSTGRSAQWY